MGGAGSLRERTTTACSWFFSNGVGRGEEEVRTGNAMILDLYGCIVAESTAIEDGMIVADLDLSLVPGSSGQRWMTGRRPELYSLLTDRLGNERSARAMRFDLKE